MPAIKRRSKSVKDIPLSSEIEAVVKSIRKNKGENAAVLGRDIRQPFRIRTNVFTLDYALLGGIPFNRTTMIHGKKHGGKQHRVSDCVLTPTGWREYGQLREGDYVIGSDGLPTEVVGIFHQGVRTTYRVTFTDGAFSIVGDEHLWYVQTTKQATSGRGHGLVVSTEYLANTTLRPPSGKGYRFRVPLVKPVQFAESGVPLPIDPYLLGVLLANGGIGEGKPVFTTNDLGVVEEVRRRNSGRDIVEHTSEGSAARRWYVASYVYLTRCNPVSEALRSLDLCKTSHHKFIPEMYLRASVGDRVALLHGLMDCDGSVSSTDTTTTHHKGSASYHTRSQMLASGVQELVRSLGGIATINQQAGHDGEIDFNVQIVMPLNILPFQACEAKLGRYTSRGHRGPVRSIVSVERDEPAESLCIAVAASDHLYVTEGYVVTHNTTLSKKIVASIQQSLPEQIPVWIDIEDTYDSVWAGKLGVDNDRLHVIKPDTGEDAVDMTVALVHAKETSLVVVDSLAGMLPYKEEEGSAEDESIPGLQAKLITRMLRRTTAAIMKERKRGHFVSLLVLNQHRAKIGGWSPSGEPRSLPGGVALGHFTSVEIHVKNKEVSKSNGEGLETLAYNDHSFNIEKNKLNAGMRTGDFQMLRRDNDDLGLKEGDVDDAGTMLAFAKRIGWYDGTPKSGYTLAFGDVSVEYDNVEQAVKGLYEDREIYEALRMQLIVQNALQQKMPDDFIQYLLGN